MGQIVGQPDPRDLIEAATPLPWWTNEGASVIYGNDGDAIADCYGNAAHLVDGKHRAALIVWAVNNLPALLNVAEALERMLTNPYGCRFCDAGVLRKFRPHDDNCEWEQAREALARLKESR